MDLVDIRRLILVAVAADDFLVDQLVLKGGNALELIHRIGDRGSLDLDFSIEDDFIDLEDIRKRLFRSLNDRFDSAGLVVFDERFEPRPHTRAANPRWGGYTATFKLISRKRWNEFAGDLESMRRQSEVSGPEQRRVFTIEISKYEYCKGKMAAEIDAYTCYVYTPAMIATEKIRAICQQMPEYLLRRHPAPRPRDFFDIHSVVTFAHVDLTSPDQLQMLSEMFRTKEVHKELLANIGRKREREFHSQGWAAVINAVRGKVLPFDYYFDFVSDQVRRILQVSGIK